eukprot:m.12190 g.12190  ORF g.12190 m.12190 type:complete len:59 (+) comp23867_c0_seq1:94-270(+)
MDSARVCHLAFSLNTDCLSVLVGWPGGCTEKTFKCHQTAMSRGPQHTAVSQYILCKWT